MDRGRYDLSHLCIQCGEMTRLQCCTTIPVMAGDSISINWQGVMRLSPLVRQLTVDATVDMFAFYRPHRHCYQQDWIDFMLEGTDEAITFDTIDYSTIHIEHMGCARLSGINPLWPNAMYNEVWNRYFRIPTDDGAILAPDNFPTTTNPARYGRFSARPKSIWTTGVDITTDSSDREVPAVSVMDILDLAQIKGRYHSEQVRDWFGNRYTDILGELWGSKANADADERPTLLMRNKQFLSGYDIDGTGDASLGTYSGKSANMVNLQMPRRFIPEHGAIMLMALVRFPVIHLNEIHHLMKQSQPTYKQISGDYKLWENEPPIEHQVQDFFARSTDTTPIGHMPYGQWYRSHPNVVHDQFREVTGFTFLVNDPTDLDSARYGATGEYANVFQTEALGHWQIQSLVDAQVSRAIPGPLQSVFAGTD